LSKERVRERCDVSRYEQAMFRALRPALLEVQIGLVAQGATSPSPSPKIRRGDRKLLGASVFARVRSDFSRLDRQATGGR